MKIIKYNETNVKWMIYGEPKSGKTHFCSTWPDAIFILCNERPMHAVSTQSIQIESINEMKNAIDYAKNKLKAKTIVLDSITGLYEKAEEESAKHHKVSNLADISYGKGYDTARNMLKLALVPLLELDLPVLFIAHVVESEIQLKTGQSFTKIRPAFTKQELETYVSHQCTAVSLLVDTGKKRILKLRGDEDVKIGHSLPITVDSIDNPNYDKIKELLNV